LRGGSEANILRESIQATIITNTHKIKTNLDSIFKPYFITLGFKKLFCSLTKLTQRGKEQKRIIHKNNLMKQHELEDLEKFTTLQYAKENNLWIDDFYSLGDRTLVGGHEHTLVLDCQNKTVYKSNNLINSRYLITNVLEKVDIQNKLFPETYYIIIGFTGIDNGKTRPPHIEVVLKQDYIPNLDKAEPFEIKSFMGNLGFKQTTPESYVNDSYLVFDLFPRNVLKDKEGNMYVVDAEFKYIKNLQEVNSKRGVEKEKKISKLEEGMNTIRVYELKKPNYLTEAHRKNSEGAIKNFNRINPSKIDWNKEVERQKRNARDD